MYVTGITFFSTQKKNILYFLFLSKPDVYFFSNKKNQYNAKKPGCQLLFYIDLYKIKIKAKNNR